MGGFQNHRGSEITLPNTSHVNLHNSKSNQKFGGSYNTSPSGNNNMIGELSANKLNSMGK